MGEGSRVRVHCLPKSLLNPIEPNAAAWCGNGAEGSSALLGDRRRWRYVRICVAHIDRALQREHARRVGSGRREIYLHITAKEPNARDVWRKGRDCAFDDAV